MSSPSLAHDFSYMSGGSEKIFIDGPVGPLEGLWLPAGSEHRSQAVVLCHPHPLYGGTMETKLVARTARGLSESGFQTLRFNFRGVCRSAGEWDAGRGERTDLAAAIDYTLSRLPDARLGVFGFSFGALVGLDVGRRHSQVQALVGVAPPVDALEVDLSQDSVKPTLIVGASRDTIVDPAALQDWVRRLPPPAEFLFIDGADHMFGSHSGDVADVVTEFLERNIGT